MIIFIKMDDLDRKLLALLRTDARASTSALARKLSITRSTLQSRLQRLEKNGIITGYTVRLGNDYQRQLVRAHVLIKVAQKLTGSTITLLRKIPEITALHAISGEYDLIAVVTAETMEKLSTLLDEIANLDGIERTNSSVILETKVGA